MTTLATFAAFFAFGYSVADIVQNVVANRRINQFIKDLEQRD